MARIKKTKEPFKLDMREFIQAELDKWGLGRLISVKGPFIRDSEYRGYSSVYDSDDERWKLILKYYSPESDNLHNEEQINVILGWKARGGYWNRRQIRVAIEEVGKDRRERAQVAAVWESSQKELTTGRNSEGGFAL